MMTLPSRAGYIRVRTCGSQKCPRQSEHSSLGCGTQPSTPQSPAWFRCRTRARYSMCSARSSCFATQRFAEHTASCPPTWCECSAQNAFPQYWHVSIASS